MSPISAMFSVPQTDVSASIVVFFGILAALAIGAVSPGPSFVLVSRIAVSRSRRAGLAAALGMGAGGVIFATLALLGLTALLTELAWLYLALKIGGGLYLAYLGIRIWRGATAALPAEMAGSSLPDDGFARNAWFGLATQLSNPKTAIVYAGIFAALLPAHPATLLTIAIPPAVFAVEAGWYSIVAVVFSAARPRALYAGAKRWIDRAAGAVMAALGLRLLVDGLPRHL